MSEPIIIEAICGRCGEIFNPGGPDDIVHIATNDGAACGGIGEITGEWH